MMMGMVTAALGPVLDREHQRPHVPTPRNFFYVKRVVAAVLERSDPYQAHEA